MIKTAIFVYILMWSASTCAQITVNQQMIINQIAQLNELNQSLFVLENDEEIDALLTAKEALLTALVMQLKTTTVKKLPRVVSKKHLNFLLTRININKERNHKLAMNRDKLKQKIYQIQKNTYDFMVYLIQASRAYQSADEIVQFAQKKLRHHRQQRKQVELPKQQDSIIYQELEKNYIQFRVVHKSYQDILRYCINNPEKISVTHWLQYLTLPSMIAYLNHFELINPINDRLSSLKLDVGGIIVSISIVILIYLCHPFVFKLTSWIVETYILEPNSDYQELIYHEIRTPLRSLLIFFGLDLATASFFYRVDYRLFVENIIFVLYAFIYAWFLFKLLDSIALLQIRNITRTNKALRKELFNLSIQVIKGLIIIVIGTLCLKHFGINITAIVSTLGLGGLAFALAAKDTLSNLFGGMTILFDNVFRMGDWVKIGGDEGSVAEIGLRSTTIRTFDNALITIPNALVSISSVKNWSRRSVGRRIKMYVGVTYESDMENIRHALNDIRMMLKNHPDISNPHSTIYKDKKHFRFTSYADTYGIKNTQLVFMDKYSDFSIDILIYCFSKTVHWADWLRVKEDVLFNIAEILKKNHLEFAYPTEVRINRSQELNLK